MLQKPSRFPIVVFSHGNGSTCFSYTTLIEEFMGHSQSLLDKVERADEIIGRLRCRVTGRETRKQIEERLAAPEADLERHRSEC